MRFGTLFLCAALICPAVATGQNKDKDAEPAPGFESRVDNGSANIALDTSKGTLVKMTNLAHQGSARLTFKDGHAPVRFTVRLGQVQTIQNITIGNGKLSFPGQNLGSPEAVSYFDEQGRALGSSSNAAYTLRLEKHNNGDIDVHLSCPPGASLGKEVNVNWTRYNNFGFKRGGRFIEG